MLSAAAVGAGCDAGPVPERSAECWLGLVAHLRGDLGDAGVAGSQPPRVLHPPVGQGLSHGHGLEAYRFRRHLYYAICAILVSTPSSYSEGVR